MENIKTSSNYCSFEDRVSNVYETLEVTTQNEILERTEDASRVRKKSKLKKWVCIGVTAAVVSSCAIALAIMIYAFVSANKEGTDQCPKHVSVENGKVFNSTGTSYGDAFEIKCDRDSKLIGHSLVTCLSSGKWSGTPRCVPKTCGDLWLPNNMEVESEIISTIVGTEITLNCKDGFVTGENRTVVCQNDETWSEISSCVPVDCGVPSNIPNAELKGLLTTTYNSTFSVQCNAGYNIRGSEIVRCNENGNWNDMPRCEVVACGLPPIPVNGSISRITGTSFRENVSIKCDEGFSLNGNSDITCLANGSWTNGPTCTKLKLVRDCI